MFLIVGGDSEIGSATYRALKAQGKPVMATTRRRESVVADRLFLDLSLELDSWQLPQAKAACVCAAVARISACAADPLGTARINVDHTLALVEKLLAQGTFVLFLSTNQVFDGRVPHASVDIPYSPTSEYGRQKARTEAALREHMVRGAPVAILRLAKVISASIALWQGWIAKLSAGMPISAFSDMMVAPTPIDLVCDAISALLRDQTSGIFQLTGPRDVSYADVARMLAVHLQSEPTLVKVASACDAGLPEGAIPPNTTLDSSLLRQRYGFEVPDVHDVVRWVLAATAGCVGGKAAG